MDEEQQLTSLPQAHGFSHDAMNTTFQLRICEPDPTSAAGMAKECFDHLDFLESRLSRYVQDSDISRINQLQNGETLFISEFTHQCLLAGLDAHSRTGGLFDITLGHRIEHRKSGELGELPALVGQLVIHPDRPAVTCMSSGRMIDLGGIGKGFALDQLKQILIAWGADGGLLTAGASSLLAFGSQSWPVDLAGEQQSQRILLNNASISASSIHIQGNHIIHPGGDQAMPAHPVQRIWVTATHAAMAEIWSTALMLLDPETIPAFVAEDENVLGVYIDHDQNLVKLLAR